MQASKYNFVTTFPETQEKLLFNTRMPLLRYSPMLLGK